MSSDSGASGGKRDAVHKMPAVLRLQALIAIERHRIAHCKNPALLHVMYGNLNALQRRLELVKQNGGEG